MIRTKRTIDLSNKNGREGEWFCRNGENLNQSTRHEPWQIVRISFAQQKCVKSPTYCVSIERVIATKKKQSLRTSNQN